MENNQFNKIDELLKSKKYGELNDSEKKWVAESIGEEAYKELSLLVSNISLEQSRKISKHVKADLLTQFKSENSPAYFTWFNYRTPVYANLILVLILIPIIWFVIPSKEIIIDRPVIEQVYLTDTVRVQLPADTIFIHKTKVLEVPVYITVNAPEKKEEKSVTSKSFAEQTELLDLLVSTD